MKGLKRFMTGLAAAAVGLMFVATGAIAAPIDKKFEDKKPMVMEKIEKKELDSKAFFGERRPFFNDRKVFFNDRPFFNERPFFDDDAFFVRRPFFFNDFDVFGEEDD